jgi:hypothetical protein
MNDSLELIPGNIRNFPDRVGSPTKHTRSKPKQELQMLKMAWKEKITHRSVAKGQTNSPRWHKKRVPVS